MAPGSPDLRSLDYFLYVYVKDQVQSQRMNTLDELKARITTAKNVLRWTAGRMYAGLQMVLTVKCFAPNNFFTCKQK